MNIKLELTIEQVNVVLAGLGKLPLEVAGPVWSVVNQQAIASQQAQSQGDANENNSAEG